MPSQRDEKPLSCKSILGSVMQCHCCDVSSKAIPGQWSALVRHTVTSQNVPNGSSLYFAFTLIYPSHQYIVISRLYVTKSYNAIPLICQTLPEQFIAALFRNQTLLCVATPSQINTSSSMRIPFPSLQWLSANRFATTSTAAHVATE